ncbi:thioredoxin family protein [Microbacterium sp. NPDC077184]|uniref:thioredoxin family protein n=1 Tax=Microbacterium sp. NPDC077184 TaxID=3154764 RepID=UPI0034262F7A
MPTRISATAVLLLTAGLVLSGCAAGTDAASPSGTPAMSDEAMSTEPSEPMTESEAPAEPMTEEPMAEDAMTAGAYVDYTDGAIEATPGDKALFFHASWCPQCRALDEDLRASGAPDGLTVFKVDYDSRTDLRQKYGVTLQTTIVFVDDAGEPISSTVLYDDPSVASLVAAAP